MNEKSVFHSHAPKNGEAYPQGDYEDKYFKGHAP